MALLSSRPIVAKKYPLESLMRLRADEVDEKARALAGAARDRAKAEDERRSREGLRADYLARSQAEAASEQARLERGELSVRDLNARASWQVGVDGQKARMTEAIVEASEIEARAKEEEAERRRALSLKKAEAEAVARDHQRWERERMRAIEAQEDEAAEEVHASRLHRRGRGMSG